MLTCAARPRTLAALLVAAAALGVLLTTLLQPAAAAEPPAARRSSLADLTGLRVVLVLRDDWMNVRTTPAAASAVNALYQSNAKLFCRIDQVHADWVEVSALRSTEAVGPTTRDVWLIRSDAIVAVQTGEAER